RYLSALKDERVTAATILSGPEHPASPEAPEALIDAVHDALYAAKIISYAQGFMLMKQAANAYNWTLNYGDIALMWRGGCIIRSQFLDNIKTAYDTTPDLQNLMLDTFFNSALKACQTGWRKAIAIAVQHGIPVPAMSAALSFYDGYRSASLPANLLQAQRDYFGAHTYERHDKPRGESFHTPWATLARTPSRSD
ncbi:MAG: NADP-dependent phosphogluconate dehydrogenase, partial [Gammaproteobacteria bacterium]